MGSTLYLKNTKIKRSGDNKDMAQISESEIEKLRVDMFKMYSELEKRIDKLENKDK